jgi:hypothetical protein
MDAEANYKTFEELAAYAKQRAQHSAKRRGHQEFTYWWRVMKWAEDSAKYETDLQEEFDACVCIVEYREEYCEDVTDTAWVYSQAVHLRKMLVNRGHKVQRLSLNWLREEAEELSDDD